MKPKIIYLASYKAYHPNHNMDYNDIKKTSEHINIIGDMLEVDLEPYDIIIASPPCNYWSRANYQRHTSKYSQMTKHLLPSILEKLSNQNKPFIVENVRNFNLMNQNKMFNFPCYVYEVGRHTYWSNIPFNPSNIIQDSDFFAANRRIPGKRGWFMTPDGREVKSAGQDIQKLSRSNRQGGHNVHEVIEYWLSCIT